jgi:hypothetical protein
MLRIVAALLLTVAVTGCDHLGHGDDSDQDRQLDVRGAHTAFDLKVHDDWAITEVQDAGTCGSVSYRIDAPSEARLVVEAVPTECAEAQENTEIGNGRHGVYRTLDDVPAPRDEKAVDTGLGKATVFTQTYYECTNSCENWNEPVAIVTLETPVDAGYPTLVVRGEKETVSRADLEEIVATLMTPTPSG